MALANAIQRPGSDVFHVFNEVGLVVKRGTSGAQQPWLATSPIAGNFYFVDGPVSAGSPAVTINVAPTAQGPAPQSGHFDGIWSVEVMCPTEGAASGYRKQFGAQVTNDVIHGQGGDPAEPGALAIDGPIGADGVALLTATGRTNRTTNNVASMKSAAAGTPYHYSVHAQFGSSTGEGDRIDGLRTCNYAFRQIKAAHPSCAPKPYLHLPHGAITAPGHVSGQRSRSHAAAGASVMSRGNGDRRPCRGAGGYAPTGVPRCVVVRHRRRAPVATILQATPDSAPAR